MATWIKTKGTQTGEFGLGFDGPLMRNDSGNLNVRNSANSAFANVVAASFNTTGNVVAGNVIGNGYFLTSINGANITGNIAGNISNANYSTFAGTVITAAQPNITSVGTLTSLTVTGTTSSGNLSTGGTLSVTGNANVGNIGATNGVFTNVSGNGAALTSITGANVTGTVPSATSATTAGTVTTAAQPNITSVGTLTGLTVTGTATAGNLSTGGNLSVNGNAIITGNLTVDGNIVYINTETLAVEDPIINLQTGPNGAAPVANSGKDVGTALNYYDTAARVAFMGWDVSNAEFGLASLASITNEVVTFSTYGNLRVGNIIGNGQALTGIAAANISGQVANALVAGTVYTNAQPNITSVGTLSSLLVSGTANAGNLISTGTLSVTGNANAGNIGATNGVFTSVAGTLTTASQPNITSVGTLTSLAVTGNVTAGNFVGTFANGNSNISIPVAAGNINISAGGTPNELVITSTGVNIAGTLNATGNANVGNIGATNGVFTNVSGNGAGLTSIAGGNVTGQVANALVAGTVYTNAQPNITSVGTLTSLLVSGTANLGAVGNVKITGGSNGQLLTTDGTGNLSFTSAQSTTDTWKSDSTTIAFNTSSPATAMTLPANAIVDKVSVIVDTAFNGTSPTLTVGLSGGSASAYVESTDVNLKVTDRYDVPSQVAPVGTAGTITVTYTASGSSAGSARVIVTYSIPA